MLKRYSTLIFGLCLIAISNNNEHLYCQITNQDYFIQNISPIILYLSNEAKIQKQYNYEQLLQQYIKISILFSNDITLPDFFETSKKNFTFNKFVGYFSDLLFKSNMDCDTSCFLYQSLLWGNNTNINVVFFNSHTILQDENGNFFDTTIGEYISKKEISEWSDIRISALGCKIFSNIEGVKYSITFYNSQFFYKQKENYWKFIEGYNFLIKHFPNDPFYNAQLGLIWAYSFKNGTIAKHYFNKIPTNYYVSPEVKKLKNALKL